MSKGIVALALATLLLPAAPLVAQDGFVAGKVIPDFGKIATVESDLPVPKDAVFKVDFDAHVRADRGKINPVLDAAARFINMHAAAGVDPDKIHLAIVIHGPAVFDVTRQAVYDRGGEPTTNANAALVAELLKHHVDIYVCGQSATAQKVAKSDLLPGVKMALSAMTAHALLQQQGYTLNP